MELHYSNLHLLHDREDGSAKFAGEVGQIIKHRHPLVNLSRPELPFSLSLERTYGWVCEKYVHRINPRSLVVGFGISGLFAARFQEQFPDVQISVLALNSPTQEDVITLTKTNHRVAVYSCLYQPIQNRCDWSEATSSAFNIAYLQHGVKLAKSAVCTLISSQLLGVPMERGIKIAWPEPKE